MITTRGFTPSHITQGLMMFEVKELTEHADLQVMRRYLAQTTEDMLVAHKR